MPKPALKSAQVPDVNLSLFVALLRRRNEVQPPLPMSQVTVIWAPPCVIIYVPSLARGLMASQCLHDVGVKAAGLRLFRD